MGGRVVLEGIRGRWVVGVLGRVSIALVLLQQTAMAVVGGWHRGRDMEAGVCEGQS